MHLVRYIARTHVWHKVNPRLAHGFTQGSFCTYIYSTLASAGLCRDSKNSCVLTKPVAYLGFLHMRPCKLDKALSGCTQPPRVLHDFAPNLCVASGGENASRERRPRAATGGKRRTAASGKRQAATSDRQRQLLNGEMLHVAEEPVQQEAVVI